MRFRVIYLDGTEVEVPRTASALRAFEEKHQRSLFEIIREGMSWWADELAYASTVQLNGEERDFDEWLATVERIQMATPAVDPTGGATEDPSRADSSKPPRSRTRASKT